jgi:hypothetical protein
MNGREPTNYNATTPIQHLIDYVQRKMYRLVFTFEKAVDGGKVDQVECASRPK